MGSSPNSNSESKRGKESDCDTFGLRNHGSIQLSEVSAGNQSGGKKNKLSQFATMDNKADDHENTKN